MIPIPGGFVGNVVGNLVASAIGFAAGRARGAATGGPDPRSAAAAGLPRVRLARPLNPSFLTLQLRARRDLLSAQYRRRS